MNLQPGAGVPAGPRRHRQRDRWRRPSATPRLGSPPGRGVGDRRPAQRRRALARRAGRRRLLDWHGPVGKFNSAPLAGKQEPGHHGHPVADLLVRVAHPRAASRGPPSRLPLRLLAGSARGPGRTGASRRGSRAPPPPSPARLSERHGPSQARVEVLPRRRGRSGRPRRRAGSREPAGFLDQKLLLGRAGVPDQGPAVRCAHPGPHRRGRGRYHPPAGDPRCDRVGEGGGRRFRGILFEPSASVPLAAIRTTTYAGRDVHAGARLVLQNLGKADAREITVDDISDTAKIFASTRFNGDGVLPAESADDEDTKKAIEDILATLGATPDRSGKPGRRPGQGRRVLRSDSHPGGVARAGDGPGRSLAADRARHRRSVRRADRGARQGRRLLRPVPSRRVRPSRRGPHRRARGRPRRARGPDPRPRRRTRFPRRLPLALRGASARAAAGGGSEPRVGGEARRLREGDRRPRARRRADVAHGAGLDRHQGAPRSVRGVAGGAPRDGRRRGGARAGPGSRARRRPVTHHVARGAGRRPRRPRATRSSSISG